MVHSVSNASFKADDWFINIQKCAGQRLSATLSVSQLASTVPAPLASARLPLLYTSWIFINEVFILSLSIYHMEICTHYIHIYHRLLCISFLRLFKFSVTTHLVLLSHNALTWLALSYSFSAYLLENRSGLKPTWLVETQDYRDLGGALQQLLAANQWTTFDDMNLNIDENMTVTLKHALGTSDERNLQLISIDDNRPPKLSVGNCQTISKYLVQLITRTYIFTRSFTFVYLHCAAVQFPIQSATRRAVKSMYQIKHLPS